MIRVYQGKDYREMSHIAAELIASEIRLNPRCVLGLATGSSPIGTYQELARNCRMGDLDFSSVRSVNLDEYVGLAPENPESYHYFMNQHLFQYVNIQPENHYLPDGMAKNLKSECKKYDQLIHALGGVDLQLLGIGHNGHIGFNEPSPEISTGTHVVTLTDNTIQANSRLFKSSNDVPRKALTMGIKTILDARRIILIASGEDKKDIVYKAFCGPITPEVPASLLQLHNNVILVADKAALPDSEVRCIA